MLNTWQKTPHGKQRKKKLSFRLSCLDSSCFSLEVKFVNDVENSESCIYIVVAKALFAAQNLYIHDETKNSELFSRNGLIIGEDLDNASGERCIFTQS